MWHLRCRWIRRLRRSTTSKRVLPGMCLSIKREQRLASFLDRRAYRQSGDAREPSRTSSRFASPNADHAKPGDKHVPGRSRARG